MEPHEYLRILARRWRLIVAVPIIGIVLGFITAPANDGDAAPLFQSTHTLIVDQEARTGINLEQAAVLVRLGEIPVEAAEALGAPDPRALARQVAATADPDVGTLTLTATADDAIEAETIADAFAQALIDELGGEDLARYEASLEERVEQSVDLQARIEGLQLRLLAGDVDSQLEESELAALTSQFRTALETIEQLRNQGPPRSPLRTLEAASPGQAAETGFSAPQSRLGRMALLGLIGLALGLGLALAVERFDRRLRTKKAVQDAVGVPVVAEIPVLSRSERNDLLTTTNPTSPVVEAYRGLRTVVLLLAGLPGSRARPAGQPSGGTATQSHLALLVTSAGAEEGKTTTVAHLASLFAETGRSVLLLSADFRRPRLHRLFDVDDRPGLTDVLARGPGAPKLSEVVQDTAVKGVSIITSGSSIDNPSQLLAAVRNVVRGARHHVDVVLVDTAPLLVASDAVDLMSAADAVLLLTRWGQTTVDAARQAAEALALVEAPVIGSVLIGAPEGEAAYSYYRYYGRDSKKRRRRNADPTPELSDDDVLHATSSLVTRTDWTVLDDIDLDRVGSDVETKTPQTTSEPKRQRPAAQTPPPQSRNRPPRSPSRRSFWRP